jgi:hypothetical protein
LLNRFDSEETGDHRASMHGGLRDGRLPEHILMVHVSQV